MRLVMLLIGSLFLVQCSSSDKADETTQAVDNSNVSAIVDGKVNKTAIRKTFLSHRADIRGCYKEAHEKDPEVSGKFVVHFQIQDDGSIKDEKINSENSTIDDDDFADCLLGKIRDFQFPKAPEDQTVTVRYPLNFSGKRKMGAKPSPVEEEIN